MQLTTFTLAGPISTEACPVTVRCSVDSSAPDSFHVRGALSQAQSREISLRVRSAILATGLCPWPAGRVETAVESEAGKLQPAALDLAIAIAIAGVNLEGLLVAGELGLDGSVRPVRGVLQAALLARDLGLRGVLVPTRNAWEALEVFDAGGCVHAISQLSEIDLALTVPAGRPRQRFSSRKVLDFSDVRGQSEAVAAMERAVQTRSGLLLSGPPGTGKTMIARRIPGVLPRMPRDEQRAVTCVYSALGIADAHVTERPFRAPHHTISILGLTGGGLARRAGEVHLAARGVLFLDEIQEFSRQAIESLSLTLDSMPEVERPLIVASTTPCPCGWRAAEPIRACNCTDDMVGRHTARVTWAAKKLGLTITATTLPLTRDEQCAGSSETTRCIAERISAATATRVIAP